METEVVRCELLDGDSNYRTWRVKMRALLIVKGLADTIEPGTQGVVAAGTAAGGATNTANAADAGRSAKALALIVLNVKEHIYPLVSECATARDAWVALESNFTMQLVAQQMQLRRQLTNLSMERGETLQMYFSRAQTLLSDLRKAGVVIQEPEVVLSTLAGLPSGFNTIVTILTSQAGASHTFASVTPLVTAEDARQAARQDDRPSVTLHAGEGARHASTSSAGHGNARCFFCGQRGHVQSKCRKYKAAQAAARDSALNRFLVSQQQLIVVRWQVGQLDGCDGFVCHSSGSSGNEGECASNLCFCWAVALRESLYRMWESADPQG
jgi:hypothetical protein